ncbi:hypothetical protein JKA74_18835 [Marivirga sp. S37H4]|uniref:Uncharacterized protein n=1 Tax=Marivirga aurantiaca TaxID=2802615 RepID=A0A934X188_9BACT|nr:hypothetical protein [Marivirga aurantiaca]MBK6267108.1 hypothetical protein [Marivirga aurantiaca]
MKLNFKLGMLAIMLIVNACNPEKKEEKTASEAFEKAQKETEEQIKKVVNELPAPSEIPFLLMQTGVEFNKSLTHDLSQVSSYTGNNTKAALNLGIYATDVTYLSAYEKSQEALNYIAAIRPLADQLSLSSSFDPQTVERFEKNLSNTDSMAAIVNMAVANAERHLKATDRPKVAALLLAGSFIEGLYIATALIENYPSDILPEDTRNLILIPLVKVIIDQEEPLKDLIELLKSVEKDDMVQKLLVELELLKGQYKKLNVKELMDQGKGDQLLKDEALDNITNQAGRTRDLLTS